ncbi:MAG: CvpA family protein [Dehalococcoidia bacterium]
MNWLDLIIIVTVLWFAFTGLATGLVREVVMLIASFIGVLLAGHLYLRLADDIKIIHDDPTVDRLIAFLAIFTATVLAGQIIGSLLRDVAAALLLGPFDHVGGLAFGLVKGLIIVEVILIAFAAFPAASWMSSALTNSLIAPVFLDGAPLLLHVLPSVFSAGAKAF